MVRKRTTRRALVIPVLKLLVILALVAGGVFWYLATHSPAAQVKKRLLSAAQLVSKEAGESNAVTAFRLMAFENLLDDTVSCQIRDFPFNGTHSANTFAALIFRGRSYPRTIDITISAMECEFPTREKSSVRCLARARVGMDGQSADESRACIVTLTKRNGAWQITGFQNDNLLKK